MVQVYVFKMALKGMRRFGKNVLEGKVARFQKITAKVSVENEKLTGKDRNQSPQKKKRRRMSKMLMKKDPQHYGVNCQQPEYRSDRVKQTLSRDSRESPNDERADN